MPQTTIYVADDDILGTIDRLSREVARLQAAKKRITKIWYPERLTETLKRVCEICRSHPSSVNTISEQIIIDHD